MRLGPITRSARRRAVVDASIAAYAEWRTECAALRNADRNWASAGTTEKPLAFEAYNAALDREERAANRYALLARRIGSVAEPPVAYAPAQFETSSGGR